MVDPDLRYFQDAVDVFNITLYEGLPCRADFPNYCDARGMNDPSRFTFLLI
jgi:hypothetical protein